MTDQITGALPTLRVGELAFLDSFAGLVPCRVLAIGDASEALRSVRVKVTATRGAYRRGEEVESNVLNVCPREAVRRRKHGAVILPYLVAEG